jgi:transposase
METRIEQGPIVAWVGLDWADQGHAVCLQAVGSDQIEAYTVEQKPEALQSWVAQLQVRFPQGRIAVALEQSRGAVIYALMADEFLCLYPVPPKGLARYREAFSTSGAKNDEGDAGLLLELVRSHSDRLRAWQPEDPLTRQLRLLVEHRRETVAERTRLTNRLTALWKTYFPQALEWAGELRSLAACEFLSTWPSLQAWQAAGRTTQRRFLRRHHRWPASELEQRLDAMAQAAPLTRDRALLQASVLMTQTLVEQLRAVLAALARVEEGVAQLFAQHPDHALYDQLPGAGEALAPRLAAAFGTDRQRYQGAEQVAQFSGIAPVTAASGKQRWVHWRWACPKFLRQTFHEFADASRKKSLWAEAYYQQRRHRGASHHAAVRALAYKWIRILYRCWKSHTAYNEAVYLDALRRHHSPLWLAVGSLSLAEAKP